jgi:hypothetical protein
VCSDEEQRPDWQVAANYAALLRADRSILAWEWLRRDPVYRRAAARALHAHPPSIADEPAQHWGLHRFECADLPAPAARPMWTAECLASVLEVEAGDCARAGDAFDLSRLLPLTPLVSSSAGRCEHLLISDGLRAIRIDVLAGSVRNGPVELLYRLSGIASAEPPLLTLRRLLGLCRTGRFSASLHSPSPRAARLVLMLRALDAIASGASQRDIAQWLLGGSVGERWRLCAPSLRSRAQRLVRSARAMAYRSLLGS